MATKLEGSIQRWIGLSSDVKPGLGQNADGGRTDFAEIPIGSSFLEADTGTIARWTGTAWVAPSTDQRIVDLLTRILDEAYRERVIQEVALDVKSDDYVDALTSPL